MIGRNDANINIHATDKTGRAIASARKNLTGLGTAMRGIGGLGAGYLGVQMVRDIAGINMEFERASREVNSLLNLSEKGFRSLQDDIRAVASTMGIDLVDATKAAYQAISAGVDQKDLSGFLRTAAQASVAGLTDTETAVDVLSTVVNSFGEENIDAAKAADILFSAVKDGKTTFGELAKSLSKAAPLAAATGVDFEELAAAVAAITKRGAPTAEAMTQIRAVMIALKKPTTEMTRILQSLGVADGDALIKAHGLKGALDLLTGAAKRNGTAITQVFAETEALNGVLNLTGQNADGFGESLANAYASAGASANAFAQNNDTTIRSLERLRSSWQATVTAFGESDIAVAGLDVLANQLNKLSANLSEEEQMLAYHLGDLKRLDRESESLFSKAFSGGETGRLYALRDIWFELGESPKSYADAIKLIESRLGVLRTARESDATSAYAQAAAQGELNAAIEAQPLADDSSEAKRLDGLIRQYSELTSTPEQNMAVIRGEVEALQKELRGLDAAGLGKTREWYAAYESVMKKAIKLHGLEGAAARKKESERAAALRSLGIGRTATASGENAPAAEPYVYGRPGHLYQDTMRQREQSALAPSVVSPPPAAGPSAESAAAETFKSAANKGAESLDKIVDHMTDFSNRLQIAEQQIANAR